MDEHESARHECGIGAVYLKNRSASEKVPQYLASLAFKMQPRGQRSAGMGVYSPDSEKILSLHKGLGLVKEVFNPSNPEFMRYMKGLKGIAGISHTRYSTSGREANAHDEIQPFERAHAKRGKRFITAFNGNISNYKELNNWFLERGYHFDTNVDTEILRALLARNIRELEGNISGGNKPVDLFEVAEKTMMRLDGAYNVITLFADGNLLVFRDPNGFHPLIFGENSSMYAFASESSALEKIGISDFQDVEPGQACIISEKGVLKNNILKAQPRHCQFEFVYFARSNSSIEGINVRQARLRLGEELAKSDPLAANIDRSYIVVPAPWTSVPAAQAYAELLGLNFRIAVEKEEVLRGFINSAEVRSTLINDNYIVHRDDIAGKKVILMDDSLVRGETAHNLCNLIKVNGAKELHLRITEPEIKCPCFYGINFPTLNELAINKFNGSLEALSRWLGIDSIHFQNLEGLVRGIGLPKKNLCMACLNKEYPTHFGEKRYAEACLSEKLG